MNFDKFNEEFRKNLPSVFNNVDEKPFTFQNNNEPEKNNFPEDLSEFTEIEDEEGNIVCILYSDVSYSYRGNKYCKYILCDEKKRTREDGIAQIKNGQKIHLKDKERIYKINREMLKDKQQKIELMSKDKDLFLYNFDINKDIIFVGYTDDSVFHDKIWALYRTPDSDRFYRIFYGGGNHFDEYDYNEALKIINGKNFIPCEPIDLLNSKKVCNKSFKLNKSIKILLILPVFIALLYPLSETVFWFLSNIAPLFWADKFPSGSITEFTLKYFPYGYHPNISWFKHFSINFVSLLFFGKCFLDLFFNYENKNDKSFIFEGIIAIFFIYAIFVQNIFNIIANISIFITVLVIILLFFYH